MYDYKNKQQNIELMNNYMLTRTLSMFDYDGLPDSLPAMEIEKQLQKNGFTFITKVDDTLYAFNGGFAGQEDVYGNPTQIIINNPALPYNATLDLQNDGVLICNDDLMMGVMPLFNKHNTLLIENEITMFVHSFNTRIQTLISAGDDQTKESAENYLEKVRRGEMGVIAENQLFDGLKANSNQSSSDATSNELIELNQYVKASLFHDVGLNSNFNMKRERINSSEAEMNTDNLHPLIDNMLTNRQNAIQKLNDMYGLNIHVDFGSIWKRRNEEDKKPSNIITSSKGGGQN